MPRASSGKTVETKLDSYLIKTTKSEKEAFKEQIARMIYDTNSPFRMVDHPEFIKMIHFLRPGITLLIELILKENYQILPTRWGDVHNEPLVCATVTTMNSDIYLADTIDISGHSHTSDYLFDIAVISIKKYEKQFGCKVHSVVTNNEANMSKMRQKLQTRDDVDVIIYGCSIY